MAGELSFLLFPIIVLGLLGMGVASLLGSRREEDPLGRRPYSIYLCAVTFIALFTLLFSLFSAVSAVGKIAFTEGSFPDGCFGGPGFEQCSSSSVIMESGSPIGQDLLRPDQSGGPTHKQEVRTIVEQVAVGIMTLLVLLFHVRRLRALTEEPTFAGSAAERAYVNYLYAVCFAAVLIALSAGGAFLFAAYRAIAPGTVALADGIDTERDNALVSLLSSGVLLAASLWLFKAQWTRIEATTRSLAPSGPPQTPA